MQETHSFEVDRNILFSVMQRQAGTIAKAMLEAAMNSVDAHATRVSFKLTATTLTVRDDGRGFQSRDEILQWFGRFGTPHQEGDATFGQFRMGRGQLMSFGVNLWRTGAFRMEVDLRGKGLDYQLSAGLPEVKGCAIDVQLYNPLSESDLAEACSEFARLVRFAPISVSLNTKPASQPLASVKWTFEDDNAYGLLDKSEELKVYNLGVLVCAYPRYRFGCAGVVVSKKRLLVNFARNDIQVHECPVWAEISSKLRAQSLLQVAHKRSLSDEDRQFLAHEIAYRNAGKTLGSLAKKLKVLKSIDGRPLSMEDLAYARCVTVAEDEQANLGTKLQREGKALVLSRSTLYRFGAESVEDLLDRLDFQEHMGQWPRISNFAALAKNQVEQFITDDESQLADWEQCLLQTLRDHTAAFVQWVSKTEKSHSGSRALHAGSSNVALAWTDGSSKVVISHRMLKRAKARKAPGMHELYLLLVHEYCHDDADLESHAHDTVFYRKYHDLTLHGASELSKLAIATHRDFQRRLKALRAQRKPGTALTASTTLSANAPEMTS